jgi:hypothetical protein
MPRFSPHERVSIFSVAIISVIATFSIIALHSKRSTLISSVDVSFEIHPNGEAGRDVITSISFQGKAGLEKVFRHKDELGYLREIKVLDSAVSDQVMEEICWSPHLTSVVAPGCTVGDDFVRYLAGKRSIDVVNLSHSRVTDVSGLLSTHCEISSLVLDGCSLNKSSLTRDKGGLLSLSTFSIIGCKSQIDGVQEIVSSSPGLRRISLSGSENVAKLFSCCKSKRFVFMSLSDCDISHVIEAEGWGGMTFSTLELRNTVINDDDVNLVSGTALQYNVFNSFTANGKELGPLLRPRARGANTLRTDSDAKD